MAHGEGGGLEIDVMPGQPEQLTLAQPGTDGREIQRFEAVTLDRPEERPHLVDIERMDRASRHTRWVRELGDIAWHQPPSAPSH